MGLGRNVGKLMKARGLSYGAVARGIGINDPQTIHALVKRDSTKSEFAGKLADFFKVPLARLVADDFQVEEPADAQIKGSKIRAAAISDAEKLLVLIRTFLDTDNEGRNELMKAANSVSKAHGPATATTRRGKPR
jgi:transcriptional regulator with XRE-family HTH domain